MLGLHRRNTTVLYPEYRSGLDGSGLVHKEYVISVPKEKGELLRTVDG